MGSEINRLPDFVQKRPGRKTFRHWSRDLRKEAFIRSVQTEPIEIYREVHEFNIKIKSCIIDLQITPRHKIAIGTVSLQRKNKKCTLTLSIYRRWANLNDHEM